MHRSYLFGALSFLFSLSFSLFLSLSFFQHFAVASYGTTRELHPPIKELVAIGSVLETIYTEEGVKKNSFILEETRLFRDISMTKHFDRPFLRS